MTPFTPEAADDALRYALALTRAHLAGDPAAAATVAANMGWAEGTAMILAGWYADLIAHTGIGADALGPVAGRGGTQPDMTTPKQARAEVTKRTWGNHALS